MRSAEGDVLQTVEVVELRRAKYLQAVGCLDITTHSFALLYHVQTLEVDFEHDVLSNSSKWAVKWSL